MSNVDTFHRRCRLLRALDGDTFDVEIDLGWEITMVERVRIEGINAPEIRNDDPAPGLQAKAAAEAWIEAQGDQLTLHSTDYRRGSFGRTLGDLMGPCGGLAKHLLDTGNAVPYGS